MKKVFSFILLTGFTIAWASHAERLVWPRNKTFSDYLTEHNISTDMLSAYSKDDMKFLTEIRSGYDYWELTDEKGVLEQALIPISKEMQIHLYRKSDAQEGYTFDITPIVYKEGEFYANTVIESNIYEDTKMATHNEMLAKRLALALKNAVDTKKMQKGDRVAFVYRQKKRLEKVYDMPKLLTILYRHGNKRQYIYVDNDGRGYTGLQKKVAYTVTGKKKVTYYTYVDSGKKGRRFGMPLRHPRVTSNFSYRRWHPILHRYRPHHGTDFGARRSTPILAVNDGRVIYAGWMRGYGKTVKIKHGGGYVSLYAHQSRLRVKRGQYVKRGQIIGYVGSTGRSTGPHLHFGLMKNGRWIDPMKVLGKKSIGGSVRTKKTRYEKHAVTRYKRVDIPHAQENKRKLDAYLMKDAPTYIWRKESLEGKLFDTVRIEDEIRD